MARYTCGLMCLFFVLSVGVLQCRPLATCSDDNDCPQPLQCKERQCQPECRQTNDCASHQLCINLQCQTNTNDASTPQEPTPDNSFNEPTPELPVETKRPPTQSLGTQTNPALSCKAILEAGVKQDGVYWLDLDGTGSQQPFRAYCDMTTDQGGWTLCLNARYSKHAKHLFVAKYDKITPPNNDPFGYYDFCPHDKKSYRLALADTPGSRYSYGIVDFKLDAVEKWEQDAGKIRYIGVRSTTRTWLTKPEDPQVGLPPEAILFWYYIDPNHPAPTGDGVNGIYRGRAATQKLPTETTQRQAILGAGCQYIDLCTRLIESNFKDGYYGANQVTQQASYLHYETTQEKVDVLQRGHRVHVLYR